MTLLETALVEVSTVLGDMDIPYMLIGGMALAQWEEPRATLDIDMTIWVEPERIESTVTALCAHFRPKVNEPLKFVKERHVLPALTSKGIPVDLIFAAWPLEKEAIRNAPVRMLEGQELRVAPLDYLLFLKLTSERQKDFADAVNLLRRHYGRFDSTWLETQLAEISEALNQPTILNRYKKALSQAERR